ncbi:hypothetical protein BKA70DRAFT_1263907 [Coprinopsis sp. MPI-PUGE-AT-0042]|nr:hypothetical protein BKA70DRAFT_1263907 [Coprinopsis sp. MPI-PUGE-AT-0042]
MSGPQTRRHSFIPRFVSESASGLPPPYEPAGVRRNRRHHSQQPLPLYSTATALDLSRRADTVNDPEHGALKIKHEFHLSSKVKPLVAHGLRCSCRPGSLIQIKSTPSTTEAIQFRVEVKLDFVRSQTVNSVQLSLRGRFITSALAEGIFTFLNQTFTIWDRNMGDPRVPLSPLDGPFNRPPRFDSKLKGQYNLPFCFPFPVEICLPRKGGDVQQVVQTPQSFLERGTSASIQYELVLVLTHGLFRSNSTLSTMVTFTPSLTPPPASFLRQQAYRHGGRLLAPMDDPQGWRAFPTQSIPLSTGSRSFVLDCTVSLATPLSYTRGTVLPVFLNLACTEVYPIELAAVAMASSKPQLSLAWSRCSPSTTLCEVGKAAWWKADRTPRSPGSAHSICDLEGEIHLPSKLEPSCKTGFFDIEYFVALVAEGNPTVPPDSGCPVQITTFHLEGPLPTPFTPSSLSSHSRSSSSGVESLNSLKRSRPIEVQSLEVLHQFLA